MVARSPHDSGQDYLLHSLADNVVGAVAGAGAVVGAGAGVGAGVVDG